MSETPPNTSSNPEDEQPTTADDVARAEAEAAAADALVTSLEEAVIGGDITVTPEQISTQKGLSVFARLRLESTRRKAEATRIAIREAALQALHDEIVATVPADGAKLVKALHAAEDAALAFLKLADNYDDELRAWRRRIEELRVPTGQLEHGVGLNGINEVVVRGTTLSQLDGPSYLGLLFSVGLNDKLSPTVEWRRTAAYVALSAIGIDK